MTADDRTPEDLLQDVLLDAQRLGFLGPGPVAEHVTHARRLLAVLPDHGRSVDLGAGGGVPGLVLALMTPGLHWTLVESHQRRSAWLREAVQRLSLEDRVDVLAERAELTGRGPLRGVALAVTARSFAAPGITAECAAPLLAVGGRLWVAEPPKPVPGRWPEAGLAQLGLAPAPAAVPSWKGFVATKACPERYPRRVGIPAKRPIF